MAAWLAYLKSRLLLPDTNTPEGQSAEDMANALAYRLKRLEAFREVAERLFDRPQLERDVFAAAIPSRSRTSSSRNGPRRSTICLSAYALQRQKQALAHVRFAPRKVWSLAEARTALERLIGAARTGAGSTNS